MPRLIKDIAFEIQREWKNVSPYAQPYLDAMKSLNSIDDYYYLDSAREIVLYFLANAQGFRGEAARRLKQELKNLKP